MAHSRNAYKIFVGKSEGQMTWNTLM